MPNFRNKDYAPGMAYTPTVLALVCEVCGERLREHAQRSFDCPTIARPNNPAPAEPAKSALDVQVGGGHYKNKPIQPIEYCHANKLGPCESAIIKYATRWQEKGGLQDLLKIKHYVDLLIQLEGLQDETENRI